MLASLLTVILSYSTNWQKGDWVNGVTLFGMYVLVISVTSFYAYKCHGVLL